MDLISRCYSLCLFLVFILTVHLQAVTVNPSMCPTNKIAPHKKIASWNRGTARTFGAFYDLLSPSGTGSGGGGLYPNFPQNGRPPYNSLQEEPQKDQPDDCGEIEDYDENDLSSLTSPQRRRSEERLFFNYLNRPQEYPSQNPQRPQYPQRPQRPQIPQYPQSQYPQRPQRPPYPHRPQQPHGPQHETGVSSRPPIRSTKSPYWSGGFFGNNNYRPPSHQYPSDSVKPVGEATLETERPYRPGVVGGPIGHVVGATPLRPTRRPVSDETLQKDPTYVRYPIRQDRYLDKISRSRKLNENVNVFGSFIDLLFK